MIVAIIATTPKQIAITAIGDITPFLDNSNIPITALGRPETIPIKIIKEVPLPIPRDEICSPSHIRSIVPTTKVVIVENLKIKEGIITTAP
jgi:hypothetical protein